MKYTVVLPFAYKPYADECIARLKFPKENMLLIDNTVENMGIMKAHNLGIEKMFADHSDWLVILSAAIRFGEPGGLDFIAELEKRADHNVVEAAGVFGWHLIAFNRSTIEKVGKWDENFTPYGFDDIDYSLRIQKAFNIDGRSTQIWEKAPVDLTDAGMSHSLKLAHVHAPAEPLIEYFIKKWGRHPGDWQAESYEHPFNNPENPIQFWPQAKNGSEWMFKALQ